MLFIIMVCLTVGLACSTAMGSSQCFGLKFNHVEDNGTDGGRLYVGRGETVCLAGETVCWAAGDMRCHKINTAIFERNGRSGTKVRTGRGAVHTRKR
jgi:hypothetical protein